MKGGEQSSIYISTVCCLDNGGKNIQLIKEQPNIAAFVEKVKGFVVYFG